MDKLEHAKQRLWPEWSRQLETHRFLLLPGIMGSQLIDTQKRDRTVWVDGRIRRDIRRLGFEELTPLGGVDSRKQRILANQTVAPPIIRAPYSAYKQHVPSAHFAFDWRENMSIAADWLADFLRHAFPRFAGPISIATHSMGGCVLLALLAKTREFDDRIEKIIFVAPPFHGALRPIRVVEHGQGTPVDALVANKALRKVSATMPGLFQLALAPRNKWPSSLPCSAVALDYPIRSKADLHEPAFWSEPQHQLRKTVLGCARQYHEETAQAWPKILARFAGQLYLIVGINGLNTLSRVSGSPGNWRFHKNPKAPNGRYSNGDGSVLLQSSVLPKFDHDRIWAFVSKPRKNVHPDMMDIPEVFHSIHAIRAGENITELVPYQQFIEDVDFSRETTDSTVDPSEDLDFEERARLRSGTPRDEWEKAGLGFSDDDDLFHATHAAALRVLDQGADITKEAGKLGMSDDHLVEYIRRGLMPF